MVNRDCSGTMQPIRFADSITKLGPEYSGSVLISGSHGGRYCGYLAALAGLRGVIFNDAGVGKDKAGIGCLDYLQKHGIASATVAHESARIGDADDLYNRGRLSYCNGAAEALGCAADMSCREAAEALCSGNPFSDDVPTFEETRTVIRAQPVPIIACDSASLIRPDDEDTIIITGSHGGVIADRPDYGISVHARGAVFNDAGVGIDLAGIQRLKILDSSRIPAATVDAGTARIGDARSAWESGIISHINPLASEHGVRVGMTVPGFAEQLSM